MPSFSICIAINSKLLKCPEIKTTFSLFFLISLPILELYLIIKIGQIIGFIDVLFVIVLTALIGLFVARIQGFKILQEALRKILENKTPIFETGVSDFDLRKDILKNIAHSNKLFSNLVKKQYVYKG